jgi:hypothetical protein
MLCWTFLCKNLVEDSKNCIFYSLVIVHFIFISQDGTPIDLNAELTTNGIIFTYLDTSTAENEVNLENIFFIDESLFLSFNS